MTFCRCYLMSGNSQIWIYDILWLLPHDKDSKFESAASWQETPNLWVLPRDKKTPNLWVLPYIRDSQFYLSNNFKSVAPCRTELIPWPRLHSVHGGRIWAQANLGYQQGKYDVLPIIRTWLMILSDCDPLTLIWVKA